MLRAHEARCAIDAIHHATDAAELHQAVADACKACAIPFERLTTPAPLLYSTLAQRANGIELWRLADAFDLAALKLQQWQSHDERIDAEAIRAIRTAESGPDLWEAASWACGLFGVPLWGTLPYSDAAITARQRGHIALAEALDEADRMDTQYQRDAVADLDEGGAS